MNIFRILNVMMMEDSPNRKMNKYLLAFVQAVFLLCAFGIIGGNSLLAQNDTTQHPELLPKGLFADHQVMEVTLSANFKTLLADREKDRSQHPGRFVFKNEEGETVSLKVKLKTRGNFRRRKNQCSFPPLFLKFNDEAQDLTMFRGLRKLKLVTHCQRGKKFEQYILQEYLLYRVYNLLTDKSFRVRLLKVRYFDEDKQDELMTRYAFLIENDKDMAERLGGQIINSSNVKQRMLNDTITNLLAVFEYFAANTDWSVSESHNIKLVLTDPFNKPFPVPYDFDWSGVINPVYAVPHPRYGINSLDERLYLGICAEPWIFQRSFDMFNLNKKAIYNLYRSSDLLDERKLNNTLEFYDAFYKTINDPKEVENEIYKKCIKP